MRQGGRTAAFVPEMGEGLFIRVPFIQSPFDGADPEGMTAVLVDGVDGVGGKRGWLFAVVAVEFEHDLFTDHLIHSPFFGSDPEDSAGVEEKGIDEIIVQPVDPFRVAGYLQEVVGRLLIDTKAFVGGYDDVIVLVRNEVHDIILDKRARVGRVVGVETTPGRFFIVAKQAGCSPHPYRVAVGTEGQNLFDRRSGLPKRDRGQLERVFRQFLYHADRAVPVADPDGAFIIAAEGFHVFILSFSDHFDGLRITQFIQRDDGQAFVETDPYPAVIILRKGIDSG
nr:hypothetical protein [uncultured Parabacteroides sp.]